MCTLITLACTACVITFEVLEARSINCYQKQVSIVSDNFYKMHCKQKLCSRSKNLSKNGNCSVCEDVLENSRVAHAHINKQKTVPRIEVDLKKMVEIHFLKQIIDTDALA